MQLESVGILDASTQSLNMSINVYVACEIALNPAGTVKAFVEQLKVIQITQV